MKIQSLENNRVVKWALLCGFISVGTLCGAQKFSKPKPAGPLRNVPALEQEFMDWGLGLFVHGSFDSQLGSVPQADNYYLNLFRQSSTF